MVQLAEQWLLRSCKAFQNPYSSDAYATLLKEADQFLWAGSEMDPVRFDPLFHYCVPFTKNNV